GSEFPHIGTGKGAGSRCPDVVSFIQCIDQIQGRQKIILFDLPNRYCRILTDHLDVRDLEADTAYYFQFPKAVDRSHDISSGDLIVASVEVSGVDLVNVMISGHIALHFTGGKKSGVDDPKIGWIEKRIKVSVKIGKVQRRRNPAVIQLIPILAELPVHI